MRYLAIGAIAVAAMAGAGGASAQQTYVSIGTGGITGVYYPAGGAICRVVNEGRKVHGIRCSAESTGGSVDNVEMIAAGDLQFGIVQSDVQANAYEGREEWQGKPVAGLRSVLSLHAEPATLVASAASGIKSYTDVAGKTVNIGNPGSGQRALWDALAEAGVVDNAALKDAAELKPAETGQALCDGGIDAYFYTVGHPSTLVQETLSACDAVIADVAGDRIDRFIADKPYYRTATIPAGTYDGQDNEVKTFGVGATLVTSADVPEEVVYVVVKAVFDNFEEFKSLHPALANLTEAEMIKESLTAPLHPGAEKYYRERGWM